MTRHDFFPPVRMRRGQTQEREAGRYLDATFAGHRLHQFAESSAGEAPADERKRTVDLYSVVALSHHTLAHAIRPGAMLLACVDYSDRDIDRLLIHAKRHCRTCEVVMFEEVALRGGHSVVLVGSCSLPF